MKTQTASRISILACCLCVLLSPTAMHAQGAWSTASSVGFSPRFFLTSSAVNGKIYVIGGLDENYSILNTLEVFDPATNMWSTPATTGEFLGNFSGTSCVVGNKIYLIGGIISGSGANIVFNALQVFDPATNVWSTPATTGSFTPRIDFGCSVVGGKIYVIGGDDGKDGMLTTNIVQVFDPSSSTWSSPTTTGTFIDRKGIVTCVVDDKIYVIGGDSTAFRNPGIVNDPVKVFDPSTNTWSTPSTTGVFTPRYSYAANVVNGKIFVIGGISGDAVLNTLEVFDPSTNTWTTPVTTGQLTKRGWLTSSVVNSNIYVLGGGTNSLTLNTNEVLTPAGSSVHTDADARGFELSPNPTIGVLALNGLPENARSIVVLNLLGEQVLELKNITGTDMMLDLTGLPVGSYLVRIVSEGSVMTRMIVKE